MKKTKSKYVTVSIKKKCKYDCITPGYVFDDKDYKKLLELECLHSLHEFDLDKKIIAELGSLKSNIETILEPNLGESPTEQVSKIKKAIKKSHKRIYTAQAKHSIKPNLYKIT